jgi:hypothetical protein
MSNYNKEKIHVTKEFRTRKYIYGDESKRLIAEVDDSLDNYLDNAERIASCWNACLHLENPESDISKIINALNQLAGNHFNKVPWNQTELKVIVGESLSLIKE